MKKTQLPALGLLLVSFIGSKANAASTYSYLYVAGQDTYTVPVGSVFSVPVYLQETADPSGSSLLTDEAGLGSAAINVGYSAGSTGTIFTGVAANIGAVPTGFDVDLAPGSFDSANASFNEAVTDFLGSGVTAIALPDNGVSRVLLGTLQVQASATPGDHTTFTFSLPDTILGSTFTQLTHFNLDVSSDPGTYASAAPSSFDVITIVPEPMSLSFLTGIGMTLSLLRRRTAMRPEDL